LREIKFNEDTTPQIQLHAAKEQHKDSAPFFKESPPVALTILHTVALPYTSSVLRERESARARARERERERERE
jgi:hypothetical protein